MQNSILNELCHHLGDESHLRSTCDCYSVVLLSVISYCLHCANECSILSVTVQQGINCQIARFCINIHFSASNDDILFLLTVERV